MVLLHLQPLRGNSNNFPVATPQRLRYMWFISLFKHCQHRFVAFLTQLVSGALTKDAARRPIRNLRKQETCCDFSLLTGHPPRPLLSGPALRDPRGHFTLQYKRGERRSGPPTPPPPTPARHAFSLSVPARWGPERINRTPSLAQSLSSPLMKCNLPRPNIIHHPPAAAVHKRTSVCPPPQLVFSFSLSLLQTAGTQTEIEWL